MGVARDPSLSRRAAWRRTVLVGRSRSARRGRRLDGLVAYRAAARFSGRRVLGLLSHARRQAELAGDQRRAGAVRERFRQTGAVAGRPVFPAWRDAIARRHYRRDVAVSILRTRDRAA